MHVPENDIALLIRDKYKGDARTSAVDISSDIKRLAAGMPLAYVIGWIPFFDCRIYLDSHPLIPRPETEWWVEQLIAHIKEHSCSALRVLDLCAGSGAIGIAIAKAIPDIQVSFGELRSEHEETIRKNLKENNIAAGNADIRIGDLFEPFKGEKFGIIATNPPYIPSQRRLDDSVTNFEPQEALFAGPDGLAVIRQVLKQAQEYLIPGGEVWMECDIENIEEAAKIAHGATIAIHEDPYGRPRLLVAHF